MPKFRKKLVVIEAVQNTRENMKSDHSPQWLKDAAIRETVTWGHGTGELYIKTLEGVMTADPGDWIIRGVQGELYPCKPDIFAATYEAADDSPAQALEV